jgi:Right handed beta helix region
MKLPVLLLFGTILTVSAAAQSTLAVPAQFSTIQAAVTAAVDGDTITVAAGTYLETLDLGTKEIALISSAGAGSTIINAQATGTVLAIKGNQSRATLIDGFTLLNGLGASGEAGGVHIEDSAPTLRNCIVERCQGGPGLFVTTIISDMSNAGGIGVRNGAPLIEDCEVRNNLGGTGGFYIPPFPSAPIIQLLGAPGGIGAFGATDGPSSTQLTLRRCVVTDNQGSGTSAAPGGTGGVDFRGSSFTVEQLLVAQNTGGSSVLDPAVPFSGIGGTGGMILDSTGIATLRFTTVTANQAGFGTSGFQTQGYGMRMSGAAGTVEHLIVADNLGFPGDELIVNGASVSYSNLPLVLPGVGNVSLPSSFADPANGDFRLSASSALRDLGRPVQDAVPERDADGNFRWLGSGAEMGCYEIDELGGSGEDLQLRTVVNGMSDADFPTEPVMGGDLVQVSFGTDGGSLFGTVPALFVQVFSNGTQPASPTGFPELEINDQNTTVLFDGNVFGPAILGPQPYTFLYAMPQVTGITGRLQAVAFTAAANNGIFATSRAHDLVFP